MTPISIKQIKDTIDLKCITPPACRTFENDIQAVIDKLCTLVPEDITGLTSTCLTVPTTYTLKQILQLLLSNCPTTGGTSGGTNSGLDISNLNLCDSDNWKLTDNKCIQLLDNCNNPIITYTLKEIIQLIIKRLISIEELLIEQNTKITKLETDYNLLKARIDAIETNCCNITLVSQINSLGVRVSTTETKIMNIENTCC